MDLRKVAGCGRAFGRSPVEKRRGEVESTGTLPGRDTAAQAKLESKARDTDCAEAHPGHDPFQGLTSTCLLSSVFPVEPLAGFSGSRSCVAGTSRRWYGSMSHVSLHVYDIA